MSNEKNPDAGGLLALVDLHADQDFLRACDLDPAPIHGDRGIANMRFVRPREHAICPPKCSERALYPNL